MQQTTRKITVVMGGILSTFYQAEWLTQVCHSLPKM